ncbi:MAG: peptide-methionine (S)-S-oxide reductase MsrA [Rhodanobacter sp.]
MHKPTQTAPRFPSWLKSVAQTLPMLVALAACAPSNADPIVAAAASPATISADQAGVASTIPAVAASAPTTNPGVSRAVAVFAGGCFWCMQPPYDKLPGVISTQAGYTGGHTQRPTYEQVSAGGTGHAEAVKVVYDPKKVSYPQLLEVFWHNIDPVAVNRQFCDVGDQYRSAIFPIGDQQRREAEASKRAVQSDPRFRQAIATRIEPAATFYPAEEYHQQYYRKNPIRYKYYRHGCGRDQRLQQIWGNQR